MVLSNHVKNEIKFIQDGDCILAPNTHNFYQCTRFPDCEGAYLYFDSNKGCFIRSGKVTRRGFIAQGKEHFEGAKKVTASLHFYDMYPSSTCTRALNWGTKGTFESLQQVIGAGWVPTSDAAKLLDRSWKDGGLMILMRKKVNR
jgi:hypothetical protein